MDNFFLEEDEYYQTQCGEMFFTTKGRLIFHCTLCNNKRFNGFDLFEIHIKEHIPMSFNDEQTGRTETSQYDTVEIFENEFKDSNDIIENQPMTVSLIKEEILLIDEEEALKEEEIPLSEIKKQKRLRLQSGRRVIKTSRNNKTIAINAKPKQPHKDSGGNIDAAKQKMPSYKNVQIPKVVREVQTRIYPRSLLTPAEDRKHKCPVCGVAFKDKHNMVHHLKRHSDNKDHKCPECDKRFYTTTEVRIHMRSHKNERPFLCNMCGRSYVSNSHLLEHLKRHSNQRNYKCEVCEKAFYNKAQLTGHMVGHSNDRPFSCEICGANFTRQKALKNHLKLHENKREFKCELCDSGFNQRAGLFSHMKAAHRSE